LQAATDVDNTVRWAVTPVRSTLVKIRLKFAAPAALAGLAALGLAACSGPQVRSLGTGGGMPAYELRGTSLGALEAEASRLCASGYDVLRWSEHFARPQPDDNPGTQLLQQAGDWLSGMPGNQAQATVRCRG
jgi:hypothetical protein